MAMQYVDCTVTIKDEDTVGIDYFCDGSKCSTKGKLGGDAFAKLVAERLNHWINFALRYQEERPGTPNPCQVTDLQVIGLNLYRILFGNTEEGIGKEFSDAYSDFERKRAGTGAVDMRFRLRLVFEQAAKELGNLPWEFLFIPGEEDQNDLDRGFFFAGEKTELILTRCVPESKIIKEMISQQPPKPERLRILLVISSPQGDGLTKIDDKETTPVLEQIRNIRGAEIGDIVKDPTLSELSDAIKKRIPHIVHFIGHGREGELALVKSSDEDDYDETIASNIPQTRWINSKAFRNLFSTPKPRLIFLHACKGAVATSQEGFSSIARELAYAEIPAVVAMQYNISNRDAGKFAKRFYEELANGRDIDEAVKEGRLELGQVYPQWAHPRFGTPVVYMQSNSAMVLPTNEEPDKSDEGQGEDITRGLARPGGSVGAVVNLPIEPVATQRAAAAPAEPAKAAASGVEG